MFPIPIIVRSILLVIITVMYCAGQLSEILGSLTQLWAWVRDEEGLCVMSKRFIDIATKFPNIG